jgi:hypothetical protein
VRSSGCRDVAITAGGLAVGATIAMSSLAMSGAGHGWNSAAISSLSIIGAPAAGFAWSHGRKSGIVIAVLAVALAVFIDVAIWTATQEEGVEYARKVYFQGGSLVPVWASLMALWQSLAAAALVANCFSAWREHRGRG